mgnify:CR=1 FL=1
MSGIKRWLRIWLEEQGFKDPEDVRVQEHNGMVTAAFTSELPDEMFERLRKVLKEKKWSANVTIYDNTQNVMLDLGLGNEDEEP